MIKKGLKVIVLAGKDKKKEGEIIEIDRQSNRAKVKDINMVKKHIKTTKEKKGGIVSIESFINLSNLKLVDLIKVILREEEVEDGRLQRVLHARSFRYCQAFLRCEHRRKGLPVPGAGRQHAAVCCRSQRHHVQARREGTVFHAW